MQKIRKLIAKIQETRTESRADLCKKFDELKEEVEKEKVDERLVSLGQYEPKARDSK